jgi:biotin carboxyl carrier protein
MKKLRVTVDGTVFEVTVEIPDEVGQAPAAAPAPAPAPSAPPAAATPPPPAPAPAPAAAGHGPGDVRSPMAGKLVSIDVQVGQTVAEGAQVATVEAMKMNTFVNAHKAGRVVSVSAKKPGEPVEEGEALAVVE